MALIGDFAHRNQIKGIIYSIIVQAGKPNRSLIIIVLSVSLLTTAGHSLPSYGDHVLLAIDGTVSQKGCDVIGGTIIKEPLTADHMPIDICKFGDRNLQIITYWVCAASVGHWTDPETGIEYGFPTPCDEPKIPQKRCDRAIKAYEYYRQNTTSMLYNELVMVEKRPFYIQIGIDGYSHCTDWQFNQTEKRLSLFVSGGRYDVAPMNITIPTALLDGNFTILMNGQETKDYSLQDGEHISTIMTNLSLSTRDSGFPEGRIDVIGTNVVPEFPISVAVLAALISAAVIAGRFIKIHT